MSAHRKTKPEWTKKPPGPSRYKEQYGVIVVCECEADQKRLFAELQREYPLFKVKVVTT